MNIAPNSKYQILISKHNRIAKILITDIHLNYSHCGWEYNLCILRQIYWISGSIGLIRKILSNCFFCKRQNAKPVQPEMANLLNICLQSHVKPFSNTGVDYFGPIQAKTSHKTRRNQGTIKTYGVIFTCLNTRAVHIELSGDLWTDSFILSLCRFLARRGHVNIMQSNNGPNCTGAVKEINDAIKNLKHDKITTYVSKHQIKWQFKLSPSPFSSLQPPSPPSPTLSLWIGSWWESLIKTVKKMLICNIKK